MKDSLPDLKFELIADGIGQGLILLEQNDCGEAHSVAIHPLHLRYLAEQFGLLPASDPPPQKTIAMLTRRLLVLHERINHLADWLVTYSDFKHADLSYEQTYARATADIADEFCAELIDTESTGAENAFMGCFETPADKDDTDNPAPPAQASLI